MKTTPIYVRRCWRLVCCALCIACCAGCADEDAERATGLVESTRFSPTLEDQNADPDIVEVQLVAATGKQRYLDGETSVWGYRDGSIADSEVAVPGPMLEVRRGQRVIVHFENRLPEGTTIHWHGLLVPNASDGTPSVQAEVEPGESFDYVFVADVAGTFWYHPHARSDVQIERGLYGPIVVRDDDELKVDRDRMFMLDDVKLNADGTLSEDTTQLDVMLGRQGNVVLANGTRGGRVIATRGARERWRFVNTSNGRYFNLRFVGLDFKVIGWDGGMLADPYTPETLLIVPGERYEVLVDLPETSRGQLKLETVHYDRGHDVPDPGPRAVFEVQLDGPVAAQAASLPERWGRAAELDVPDNARERRLELTEAMIEGEEFPVFRINGREFPNVPVLDAHVGEVEIWSIFNNSEMDHPFHLHGAFFRVLDVDDVPPEHQGWKDTVNVPRMQTLRFAVRYVEPGTWMYHCHILEHAERGMMGELMLSPRPDNQD